jgi:hypothetical protein
MVLYGYDLCSSAVRAFRSKLGRRAEVINFLTFSGAGLYEAPEKMFSGTENPKLRAEHKVHRDSEFRAACE